MTRIAIFASGSGSNAERIATYFNDVENTEVVLILTNNPQAGVIERAGRLHIPVLIFDRKTFRTKGKISGMLKALEVDWVILAGFLWLVPDDLTEAFEGRMVNIHPALLPAYGGKGMWGHFVHEAVIGNKEKESGITIHFVNSHYDEGKVIFQASCTIDETDTPDTLAQKIHALEYEHFPRIIHELITGVR